MNNETYIYKHTYIHICTYLHTYTPKKKKLSMKIKQINKNQEFMTTVVQSVSCSVKVSFEVRFKSSNRINR